MQNRARQTTTSSTAPEATNNTSTAASKTGTSTVKRPTTLASRPKAVNNHKKSNATSTNNTAAASANKIATGRAPIQNRVRPAIATSTNRTNKLSNVNNKTATRKATGASVAGSKLAIKKKQEEAKKQLSKGDGDELLSGGDEEYDEEDAEGENNIDGTVEYDSLATILKKQRIDLAKFKVKLQRKGLWVKECGGDGNCFFRAMADQLYGFEYKHISLRKEIVEHLQANKEECKLFIENDMSIEKYIRIIGKDGAWGGQLEMSILAQRHKFNVIVHQIDYEDMAQEFFSWNTKGLKTVHLTYHRGRHYNSVRSKSDPGYGPAIKYPI